MHLCPLRVELNAISGGPESLFVVAESSITGAAVGVELLQLFAPCILLLLRGFGLFGRRHELFECNNGVSVVLQS